MKRICYLTLVQLFCVGICSAQNPRWKLVDETPIPPHVNLDVRWTASTKTLPSKVWVYHLLPYHFSAEAISNVIMGCSFTEQEVKARKGNEVYFADKTGRKLSISASGSIHFETPEAKFSPTKLAQGVPLMSELPGLATNFVRQIGIPISEVMGYFETDKFNFSEPLTMYYVGDTTITNIAFRSIKFRRSVDRIPFVGGDGASVDIGEYGKPARIDVTWHDLKRFKSYPTVSQKTIIGFLRQGKTFQGLLPMSIGAIDWSAVKSVTIKKVLPCYFAGNTENIYPFLVLFATLDNGQESVDVQIECPMIDETKL